MMDVNDKMRAMEDLKVYHGDPPHDVPSNHARGDGYFAVSLETKYRMPLEALAQLSGYNEWKNVERAARAGYLRTINAETEQEVAAVRRQKIGRSVLVGPGRKLEL